ncbi:hypothetical protein PsorP6_000917 [Peronosclerospora sorghi]|uniref:Uncharacterized protein n=1 Tax=Peronosclerospora sorghi TaxID=230839 RepID=A0ACC0WVZ1_9STRA|nr:hypothetical protein PsorP6_000917 [Peronosclerospora sorghi]
MISPRASVVVILFLWSHPGRLLATGRRYLRPVAYDVMSVATASRAAAIQQLERIYCHGELLHQVQMLQLFTDSKHFVDMPIKATSSVNEVLTTFEELQRSFNMTRREEWKTELAAFVERHFDPPGAELIAITPPDYREGEIPSHITKIRNETLRLWAMELHKLWKVLARVPATPLATLQSNSSFLYSLPILSTSEEDSRSALARQFNGENVLIVPGGRFRESYYWDSYWIVQGLLVSGLNQTARGVVNHLLEYVAEFGFVPNGGRIYYLTRSQPPMLSDMVQLVATLDGRDTSNGDSVSWDLKYLRATVPLLEQEYLFWMQRGPHGHAVEFRGSEFSESENDTIVLNRYVAHAGRPRPESYREDMSTASAKQLVDKTMVYDEIIAAAESGWDFSSRWFGDYSTLTTIRTSRVIPVELNSILHRVELNLAKFHELLGNAVASARFTHAAKARVRAMDAVLWSESEGCWKDYLLDSHEHSNVVSVSNYSPLWGNAFDTSNLPRLEKIVTSLETSGLLQAGGVQTTTRVTSQQWDAPNAWPPLQDIIIEGLQKVGTPKALVLSKQLIKTWVKANFEAWQKTGLMFEKYNAQRPGVVGNGGEYTPQVGFGWSNGAILTFLTKYQDQADESTGESGDDFTMRAGHLVSLLLVAFLACALPLGYARDTPPTAGATTSMDTADKEQTPGIITIKAVVERPALVRSKSPPSNTPSTTTTTASIPAPIRIGLRKLYFRSDVAALCTRACCVSTLGVSLKLFAALSTFGSWMASFTASLVALLMGNDWLRGSVEGW